MKQNLFKHFIFGASTDLKHGSVKDSEAFARSSLTDSGRVPRKPDAGRAFVSKNEMVRIDFVKTIISLTTVGLFGPFSNRICVVLLI